MASKALAAIVGLLISSAVARAEKQPRFVVTLANSWVGLQTIAVLYDDGQLLFRTYDASRQTPWQEAQLSIPEVNRVLAESRALRKHAITEEEKLARFALDDTVYCFRSWQHGRDVSACHGEDAAAIRHVLRRFKQLAAPRAHRWNPRSYKVSMWKSVTDCGPHPSEWDPTWPLPSWTETQARASVLVPRKPRWNQDPSDPKGCVMLDDGGHVAWYEPHVPLASLWDLSAPAETR